MIMNVSSGLKPQGEFRCIIRDRHGRFVKRPVFHNTSTNTLRGNMAQWLIGVNNTGYNPVLSPNKIALGDGAPTPPLTGPDQSDTGLWHEIAGTRKACNARQITNGYYAQYTVVWTATDPRCSPTEAGLMDDNGVLLAHVALSGVTLQDGQTLTGIWRILVQGNQT